MIVGNDISNAQGQINFATYGSNSNFVIAKATEGVGYIDTWYANNRTQARGVNLPFGSYHFARPDLGNSATDEANFFCNVIDGDPIRQGEVLALDYEVTYNDPVNWCLEWLQAVSSHYNGMKPLIYLNQSTASGYDWTPVINAGFGLWIASYTYDPTINTFNGGKWQTCVIQQWTDQQQVPGISGSVDGNVFFGDASQFKQYGYQVPITTISQEKPVLANPTPSQTISTEVPPVSPTQPISTTTAQPPVSNPVQVVTQTPTKNETPTAQPNLLIQFLQWLIKLLS